MVYVYPAIFTKSKDGYAIRFPDLPGTNSQGKDMADAIYMARDALALWLDVMMDEGDEIPQASAPSDITLEPGQIVTMIDTDMEAFRRRKDSKAVKKTVTIPSWLNEEAEAHKVNFSAILQEGLKNHLGLENPVKRQP
jgi:predicted RNase H-like HicB family nuclease